MNDSDYLAVFHQLIMPLAINFNPDAVIVSAGFDCALGDPEVKKPAPNMHVICENKIAPKNVEWSMLTIISICKAQFNYFVF